MDYHSWNPGIDLSSFFAFSLYLGMKTKKSVGSHQQDKHNNGSETSGPPQPATSSTQVCWTFQFNFNLKKKIIIDLQDLIIFPVAFDISCVF